jgi:hypothetical protein
MTDEMQQKILIRMPRLRTKTLLMKIILNQIIWTISFTTGKLVKKSLKKPQFDKCYSHQ